MNLISESIFASSETRLLTGRVDPNDTSYVTEGFDGVTTHELTPDSALLIIRNVIYPIFP